jgi:hypothetical protein
MEPLVCHGNHWQPLTALFEVGLVLEGTTIIILFLLVCRNTTDDYAEGGSILSGFSWLAISFQLAVVISLIAAAALDVLDLAYHNYWVTIYFATILSDLTRKFAAHIFWHDTNTIPI